MEKFDTSMLSNCEREPLAFSGRIQGHGVLLYLESASGCFTFVSENAESLLGEPVAELLGADGRSWVEDMLPTLGTLPVGTGNRVYLEAALDLGEGEMDVLVSPTGGGWLIEIEPASDAAQVVLPTLPASATVGDAEAMKALWQALVDGISVLTGYDRIMLYQFLPDWSGEVLAERALRSPGTYLSLRFPASDVPAVARALYAQAPYRHIPDATAATVGVLAGSEAGTLLDLTWSDLRSVSPVHIEYLRNMQVAASFSVSILVGGKLWGLIASHNEVSLHIPMAARLACVRLVEAFVDQVNQQRLAKQKVVFETLGSALGGAVDAATGFVAEEELATAIASALEQLPSLMDYAGGAVAVGGTVAGFGDGPDKSIVEALASARLNTRFDEIQTEESLPETFPLRAEAQAAGVFGYASFNLRASRHGDALVSVFFFRPEEVEEVAWAGNPEKPVEVDASGAVHLSPRKSFEKWMQVREEMCRVWNEDDMFVLALLRQQLMESLG